MYFRFAYLKIKNSTSISFIVRFLTKYNNLSGLWYINSLANCYETREEQETKYKPYLNGMSFFTLKSTYLARWAFKQQKRTPTGYDFPCKILHSSVRLTLYNVNRIENRKWNRKFYRDHYLSSSYLHCLKYLNLAFYVADVINWANTEYLTSIRLKNFKYYH